MSHPNEDTVRKAYAALDSRDWDTLRGLLAPDIEWHSPGRHSLSGDHHGPDAVLRFLSGVHDLTGGTFRVDIHDVLANDEHVVVLTRIHAERDTQSVHDNHAQVFHVRDGLITGFWGHPSDQHAVDRLLR
jgi:ketosteroid isomerase-like protein